MADAAKNTVQGDEETTITPEQLKEITQEMRQAKKEARLSVTKAIASMTFRNPFFTHLALRMDYSWDFTIPTIMTDGKQIRYNPFFIRNCDVDEIQAALCHELLHVVFMHLTRREKRHPALWNIASDYVVNWILQQEGFKIPKGGLVDPKFEGMTAEEVYRILREEMEEKGSDNPQSLFGNPMSDQLGQDTKNSKKGDGDSSSNKSGDNASSDDGNSSSGSSKEGDGTDSDDNSTGGNGDEAEGMENPHHHHEGGCYSEPTGNVEELERELKNALSSAATVARQAGKLSAGLDRIIDDLLYPKVPWTKILRSYVEERVVNNNYNWLRPSRHHLNQGTYLPSLYNKELGTIVVMVDTSGSISPDELNIALSEISSMFIDLKAEKVYVLYIDSQICSIEEYTSEDLPIDGKKSKPKGGGGTSFVPGFKWIEKNSIDPQLVIYFTDLWGEFPREPSYPVIWCTFDNGGLDEDSDSNPNVPFGHTIDVSEIRNKKQ